MKEPEKRFCKGCGEEMLAYLRPASENMIPTYMGHEIKLLRFARPYDEKTGKRNDCWYYRCPEYDKQGWWQWSDHDEYFIDKIIIN